VSETNVDAQSVQTNGFGVVSPSLQIRGTGEFDLA
jgi:hypothetical protein